MEFGMAFLMEIICSLIEGSFNKLGWMSFN